MIKKIAHISDIHIRKNPNRNVEYRNVFNRLYKSLSKEKPDRIVISGDIVNDYIDLQGEQLILVGEFLNELSKIALVIVTRGNHDVLTKALKRMDPIEAIVTTLKNKNIVYYNSTNFFVDDNVVWAVWHHGDKKSPWKRGYKKIEDKTYIDIFHDPVKNAKSSEGFEFNKSNLTTIEMFHGDYSFFGDIHMLQYFSNKTKAYPSSLISQNFSEGDDNFHGYLLWDIENNDVREIEIHNDYSYKTVKVNNYSDFDDLDIEIENPTKFMRVRVLWNTYPHMANVENERKIKEYLNKQYDNIILLKHKADYVEENKIDDIDNETLENIFSKDVQHDIFRKYLVKIGVDDDTIDEVLKLDDEITERIPEDEVSHLQWDIVKYWGKNIFSYEDFSIDWRDLDGLTQIVGENAAGKTTLLTKILGYILYGKTIETSDVEKNGDSRFINKYNDAKYGEGNLVIEANGEYYGIRRTTTLEYNKAGELKGSPSNLYYYYLTTPDDDFTDEKLVENLDSERKFKTQKDINRIIGTFDNFIRVIMTTSDTLNMILSSKPAEFIDSILLDSGMDIFDLKLNEFKNYIKEKNTVPRIVCDVTKSKETIDNIMNQNKEIDENIKKLQNVSIPEVEKRIKLGETYIETETSKLFKIDDEILNLNLDDINKEIRKYEAENEEYNQLILKLKEENKILPNSFDDVFYSELLTKKDEFRQQENSKKLEISSKEKEIIELKHQIEKLNGENLTHSKYGKKLKEDAIRLNNSKTCPVCGGEMKKEHIEHVQIEVNKLKKEMDSLASLIRANDEKIKEYPPKINLIENEINLLRSSIDNISLESTSLLEVIGEYTNKKNDYEKKLKNDNELKNLPIFIENNQLKIENKKDIINRHENQKTQIIHNKQISLNISNGKDLLVKLRNELNHNNELLLHEKNKLNNNINEIDRIKKLIIDYKKQIKVDEVRELYKNSIHRNGIPTQILKTRIIPKINNELSDLLKELKFNVWIDSDDLKVKMSYNNKPDAIINAISGSGKERTFSSIALKVSLNQINVKSKPRIMLLDEMMGKLTGDSIDEFIELLNIIVKKMRKIVIIEHNHELNPDNIIFATKDENNISKFEIQ